MREKGIVLTSISAIAYGLVPLFTVYLMDASFDAISIGFFRFFLMGLYTFVVALLTRSSFKMDKSMWPSLLLAAIGQCATILLLNVSYEMIPVGNATSLHFMYPIFVSLILYYYYRNQFSKRQVIALCLSVVGIVCFMDISNMGNLLGMLLALCSGFTYAMYMVLLEKHHLTQLSSSVLTTYLCLIESVVLFVLGLTQNSFSISFDANIVFYLIILVGFTLIGQLFLQKGTHYIGAAMASLFCLFEPLTSLISGWIFLGEPVRIMSIIGCGFICVGIMQIMTRKE